MFVWEPSTEVGQDTPGEHFYAFRRQICRMIQCSLPTQSLFSLGCCSRLKSSANDVAGVNGSPSESGRMLLLPAQYGQKIHPLHPRASKPSSPMAGESQPLIHPHGLQCSSSRKDTEQQAPPWWWGVWVPCSTCSHLEFTRWASARAGNSHVWCCKAV